MQLGKYEIDFNNIAYLSEKMRVSILVVIGVLLFLFIYWLGISGQSVDLKVEKKKEISLKSELTKDYQMTANLSEYESRYLTVQNELHAFVDKLPDQTEVPNLIETLNQTAKKLTVDVVTLKVGKVVSRDFYKMQPLELNVQGTYHNLAAFISALENMPALMSVVRFDLTPELNSAPTFNRMIVANLYVQVYRHQQATKSLAEKKK
tara:strand:+ start:69128 stop:69745 length:618 start_codon:yes stop_codon:yes gene_type:complete